MVNLQRVKGKGSSIDEGMGLRKFSVWLKKEMALEFGARSGWKRRLRTGQRKIKIKIAHSHDIF